MKYLAVILLLVFSLCQSCDNHPAQTESSFEEYHYEVMSTTLTVSLPKGKDSAELANTVFELFQFYENELNEWKTDSPLALLNQSHQEVEVSEDLFEILQQGKEIGELTDGAFDITWAALWGLWDFEAKKLPDPEELRKKLAYVDYRKIKLDSKNRSVRLPENMTIGLGGIAKGFALDKAATLLRERGHRDFLLTIGGQVLAAGHKNGAPWKVGIRKPRGGGHDYFTVLELSDQVVSTSGDYERFFILNGQRYHHIIDPRTGEPSSHLQSVTVIAQKASWADALSTSLMVMEREKGLALVGKLPAVEAVWVDDQGQIFRSSGLTK